MHVDHKPWQLDNNSCGKMFLFWVKISISVQERPDLNCTIGERLECMWMLIRWDMMMDRQNTIMCLIHQRGIQEGCSWCRGPSWRQNMFFSLRFRCTFFKFNPSVQHFRFNRERFGYTYRWPLQVKPGSAPVHRNFSEQTRWSSGMWWRHSRLPITFQNG